MKRPEEFDVAFIDADVLKYSAGFAAERTKYHLYDPDGDLIETFDSHKEVKSYLEDIAEFFGEPVDEYKYEAEKIIGEEQHALNACDTIVRFIKDRVDAKEYKFYLSGKGNFREKVATLYEYGHNRKSTVKPYWINSVVEHLKKKYGAKVVDGIEGDDLVGVGMTAMIKKGKVPIHVGVDKDILYVVDGWHFDFKKDEFHYTTHGDAIRFKYAQALAGDSTDGFHGIPKIGLKKAYKILSECTTEEEMYKASVEAYRAFFGDKYAYKSWDGRELERTPEELFEENMVLGWIMLEKDKTWNNKSIKEFK